MSSTGEVWVEPHDTYLRHNLSKRFVWGMWLMSTRRAAAHFAVAVVAGWAAGNLFARMTGSWTVSVALWAVAAGIAVSWGVLSPFYDNETYHHPIGFRVWAAWQGVTAPRPPKPGRRTFALRIDPSHVQVAGMRK